VSEVSICFVCMGNICRSPTAEAVMAALVARAGLTGRIVVESAALGDWHTGAPPDPRAVAAAADRGVVLFGQARRFLASDFAAFDHVVALDREIAAGLARLATDPGHSEKISLLLQWAPDVGTPDVADPYYGESVDFAAAFELVQAGCEAMLAELVRRHGL